MKGGGRGGREGSILIYQSNKGKYIHSNSFHFNFVANFLLLIFTFLFLVVLINNQTFKHKLCDLPL